MELGVLLAFCAILILWKLVRRIRAPARPPGPWGLPLLGSLPFLDRDAPFLTLHQLSRIYGPIYRLRLGSVPVVVLATHQLIRNAFKKEAFCGKPPLYVTNGIMAGYGLIAAEGELWKEQRRFTVSCLRDFGFSKSRLSRAKLEEGIVQEINVFLADIQKFAGMPVDVHQSLRKMVGNLITSTVFGRRFDDDDQEFSRQLNMADEGSAIVEIAGTLNFLPILRFLPNFRQFLRKIFASKDEHHRFLQKVVDAHRLIPVESETVRDFIDAYLIEMDKREFLGKSSHFSEVQLLHLLADLFGAGVETSKVTLKWAFLYLMLHPEIQVRAQEEMDRVIGRNRNPCLDDVTHCPYTEAVVLEVQRMANVVPLGAPHGTTEDVSLEGYFIPKGTMIIPLLWTVHMDPENWQEPNCFRPERFIDENGKAFRPDGFMPFSAGRRACVGEELARMTLFLTLSTVLHRCTLRWPEEDGRPDLTPVPGFTISPRPYRMCALARE